MVLSAEGEGVSECDDAAMRLTDEHVEIIAAEFEKVCGAKPKGSQYYNPEIILTAEFAVKTVLELTEYLIGLDAICGHVDGSPFKYEDET